MPEIKTKEKNATNVLQEKDKLVKVVTNKGYYDWVKQKMLNYYARKGYVVCLAVEKS